MDIHPELARRLAAAKIDEARSRTQRASALRAASRDRRTLAVTVGTRRDRWVAPMLGTVSRWRARRKRLRANTPRTMNR